MDLNKLKELKEEQLKLAKEVITKDEFKEFELVGGVDQVYIEDKKVISAIVVIDKKGKIIEKKYSVKDLTFPYVPGFLLYREGPVIVDVYSKLKNKPDILMIDANGILHPRGIGMASQIGLMLDCITIGVAKNLFCGKEKGNEIYVGNGVMGIKVATKEHAKPIFVSPGHKISIKSAVKIVKEFLIEGKKLPEPIRLAHKYANKIKENIGSNNE